ncbi:MAG TPA: ABC transporter permease [Candidatus Acidoferrum sp.]|nr:ABC transporter permease [Candidatus Acidoferrum sp.]
MRWASKLFLRLKSLLRRNAVDAELGDELRFHVERQITANVASGMSPSEARRTALREFGGVDQIREECADMRQVNWLQDFAQDVRYAFRLLRKSPGFTAIVILTLALGIGANTAIFSVVYSILLAPLPYRNPSRIVVLNETNPKVGNVSVSYPNFLDWRDQSRSFSQMTDVHQIDFNLAGVTQPENISGYAVSPNFLSMLGVHPYLGRDFNPSEEKSGTAPVVLLSYSLWQSHFGADPSAVGRTITLDGKSFTTIGVLPANFRSPDKTDVIEPIGVWATDHSDDIRDRGERGDSVVMARLVPGVTISQARGEMDGIAARLAKEYPTANDQCGVRLQSIRDVFVGDLRPAILILFGAVLFVLLIVCANVANLFLVRGATRTKEVALRIAFGAGRGRIARQMLAESFVLAVLGGILGVGLAFGGVRGMGQLIPTDMLSGATISLNGMVLLFAGGIVVLAAFIFGLAPAIHATNPDVQSELKEGGRTTSAGTQQNKLRLVLATAEIALALVLMAGAGLMTRSLYRLLSVNPGFRTDHVLTMEMDLRAQQYSTDSARRNFWQQLLDRTRALPGVEGSALGTVVPLTDDHSRGDITIEGMPQPRPGSWPHPDYHKVSPGYVSTLGILLLRGRTFTDSDNENAPLVGMINAKLAREFFAHQDPIGKRFMFGHPGEANPPKWITIVGVVNDTKLYGLANPSRLEVYVPFRQLDVPGYMNLLVKSAVDPAALISSIRGVVGSIDKNQPIFAISTMDDLRSQSVSTRRITLILLGAFSLLALVLATIGIYGVISYSVAQRTHEIGIRMALGAQHRTVLGMVLGQGGKIALIGIGIGIVGALGLTRLMASLLFSVSAYDPVTFGGVAILLAMVALAACYVPARRAMRVDPIVALRHE